MPVKTILYDFITLFVILDPIGTAAIFAVMTHSVADKQRRRMGIRATVIAGAILFSFAFLGSALLTALGIGLPAFRVAGGVLLFLLATDMVFARQSGLRGMTAAEDEEANLRGDITVFPLAVPLIAGPGAMTSMILLMGRVSGDFAGVVGVLSVLLAVLAMLLVLLLYAPHLLHLLGQTGSNVVSRIMGIILAALAVQFIIDGLRDALPQL